MVKTLPPNAGGVGLIPGWGAKIPHASWPKNQNIKQKQYYNKFNKDFKNDPHEKKKMGGDFSEKNMFENHCCKNFKKGKRELQEQVYLFILCLFQEQPKVTYKTRYGTTRVFCLFVCFV